jgi:hypothetical protein
MDHQTQSLIPLINFAVNESGGGKKETGPCEFIEISATEHQLSVGVCVRGSEKGMGWLVRWW